MGMIGGIEDAAMARAIAVSMDIQSQLERQPKNKGFQPVLHMLVMARKRAVDAMTQLVIIEAHKADEIRNLQSEIKLFDDMVRACGEAINAGRDAEHRIDEEDRAAIYELIEKEWATAEKLGVTGVNDQ